MKKMVSELAGGNQKNEKAYKKEETRPTCEAMRATASV